MAGEYVRARIRLRDKDIKDWVESKLAQGHEEGDLVREAIRLMMLQDNENLESKTLKPQIKRNKKTNNSSKQVIPRMPPKMVHKESSEDAASVDDLLNNF